jgi:O-antigen/teichoic acid export membrane protein
MIGRRVITVTVFIQGFGAVANAMLAMVIAARFGPSGQGFWANFKALLDVVSVAAAYGFPAAFPFLINVRGVSDARLLRFSLIYGAALVPLTAVAIVLARFTGLIRLSSSTPYLEVALLTVSAIALAVQAMVRGVTLATSSTEIFSLMTTMPPCILLLTVLVWPSVTDQSLMPAATTASLTALAIGLWIWKRYRVPPPVTTAVTPMRELLTFGGWNFINSLALILIPAIMFQMLTAAGAARKEIGWLSIAILIQSALLTPGNMLGPVLYNWWTKIADPSLRRQSYAYLHRLALAASVGASVVAALVLRAASGALAARDFGPVVELGWILLAAVPLGYSARLMANVLLSSGQAKLFAASTVTRLVVVASVLAVLSPTPRSAAIAMVVAEVASLIVSAACLVGWLKWSWADTLGVRLVPESAPT